MEKKKFRKYYLLSLAGVFVASFYPLYMGVRVVADMITKGTVMREDYPKYIIPYTPISLALMAGVLLMPLLLKYGKKAAQLFATVLSTVVFFAFELLLESKVVVTSTRAAKLGDWQMFMCWVPPDEYMEEEVRETVAEILMGEYNPAFKLHFYMISLLIILTVLNCFYGFARMIRSGEKKRLRALIVQAVSCGIFLALCIFACFTAFFRDGSIYVSFISAVLMTIFFVLFGITAGIYAGSFLMERPKPISIGIPAVTASLMVTLMYIGEMILLRGRSYRFGKGFLFQSLSRALFLTRENIIIGGEIDKGLAPFDIIIILAAGIFCACIMKKLVIKQTKETDKQTDM